MKILIFGNIGSGKTYLATELKKYLTGFEFLAIDEFRKLHGDGTMEAEKIAKQLFIEAIKPHTNQVIEAMGFGETGEQIAEKLALSKEPKLIVILTTPLEICKKHLEKRTWNVPYPASPESAYQLAELTDLLISGRFIHDLWFGALNIDFIEIEMLSKEHINNIVSRVQPVKSFKQYEIIEQARNLLLETDEISGAFLFGTFGRGNPVFSSDVDIMAVASEPFPYEIIQQRLSECFSTTSKFILYSETRKKITVLFEALPKLEILFVAKNEDIAKYFIGSEITDVSNIVLKDKEDTLKNLLIGMLESKNAEFEFNSQFNQLLDKFIYDFENMSSQHKRSDAYKAYFLYNLALNDSFQLLQMKKGNSEFLYLPKNIKNYFPSNDETELFTKLGASLYLPDFNRKKRILLDFFYSILESCECVTNAKKQEVRAVCEWIYTRDFGYNFRDIAENCSKIKSGLIFRTSTLTRYQNNNYFDELAGKFSIKTIIDLRADRELEKDPYNENTLAKINYVWAPFDPWKQTDYFKENFAYGSHSEIAYRHFAIECKSSIKTMVETIINQNEGAVAIHCHAGKDRTGCAIALLQLLCGASKQEVYNDYFASEADTKVYKLNSFLEQVEKYRSLEEYLESCGIATLQIKELKIKLLNP